MILPPLVFPGTAILYHHSYLFSVIIFKYFFFDTIGGIQFRQITRSLSQSSSSNLNIARLRFMIKGKKGGKKTQKFLNDFTFFLQKTQILEDFFPFSCIFNEYRETIQGWAFTKLLFTNFLRSYLVGLLLNL